VVREFSDRPIDDVQVERILHAGRRTGSSKNLQRWTFIVVRDRKRLVNLAKVGPFAGHLAGAAMATALVTPDPHAANAPLSIIFDIGRVAQNMVLAAWDLGIVSCPATVHDQGRVREILGIPSDHHCEYIISFGHPADSATLRATKRSTGRRQLNDVTRFEQWDSFS
jgi:nitroreductase